MQQDTIHPRYFYLLVDSLVRAMAARDAYTCHHQTMVSRIARRIAQTMGLDSKEVEGIRVAAQLHDIGKIAIPTQLLTKVGKLDVEELALIKTHVVRGADILRDVPFPWPVQRLIEQHHERLDGSGYPQGLKGSEIELGARILAVADTVDAMVNSRPYRSALGIEKACEVLQSDSGTKYDTDVVNTFLSLVKKNDQLLITSLQSVQYMGSL